ncbi:MAG: DUF1573 domain-containing protein [Aestuariibaculum sp.]
MKKIIIGIMVSCLAVLSFISCKDNAASKIKETNVAAAAARDEQAGNFPILKFDKAEHDFGEIEKNAAQETTFTYKNTGNAPLVITEIKSTCGCTVPENWSKEPLAPGATGEFTVKFNGSGSGKVTKSITVNANTEKGSETVKISAFVKDKAAAVKS